MGQHLRVEVHHRHVGRIEAVRVLRQEVGVEAAEGVQLQAGHQAALRKLPLQGRGRGLELAGGVGKVLVYHRRGAFAHQLQPPRRAGEGSHGPKKVLALDAELLAHLLGGRNVAQVVLAKYLHGHFLVLFIEQKGFTIPNHVLVRAVADVGHVGVGGHGNELGLLVVAVVDEHAGLGRHIGEDAELLAVDFLGRKHVDVVPADARNHADVVLVEVELGPPVYRRRQVFIALDDDEGRVVGELHHQIEPRQLGPHRVVEGAAVVAQHVQNAGRDAGFAVRAANDDALLVAAGLVDVLGKGIHFQAQLLGAQQLGVVGAGVHAHNHRRQIRGDAGRVPALLRGQQAGGGEAAGGGLKNLVIRARDVGPAPVQGQRQVVHDAAAHRNKVDGFGLRVAGYRIQNIDFQLFYVSYRGFIRWHKGACRQASPPSY